MTSDRSDGDRLCHTDRTRNAGCALDAETPDPLGRVRFERQESRYSLQKNSRAGRRLLAWDRDCSSQAPAPRNDLECYLDCPSIADPCCPRYSQRHAPWACKATIKVVNSACWKPGFRYTGRSRTRALNCCSLNCKLAEL